MTEITTGGLARLFDTTPKTIGELAKRAIVMSAGKRGRWQLEPSVGGYVRHLREVAAGRGGNDGGQVRARPGAAQADLAEAKAAKLRGELVEADAVEAKWSSACRAIRSRVLAVADRMRDLPARQHVKLSRELRDALTDLSEGKA